MQDDLFRLSYQWGRTAIQRAARRAHFRLKEEDIELQVYSKNRSGR